MPSIVEVLRQEAIKELFEMDSFSNAWPIWKPDIRSLIGTPPNPNRIIDLGNSLRDIFRTTRGAGRTASGQAGLSAAGYSWEALVCYYMNLCLIGSRVVVFKHKKTLVPSSVERAMAVHYGTFPSNTESDLVAVVFPDRREANDDISRISVRDRNGNIVSPVVGNFLELFDSMVHNYFTDFEVGIIQCKTNWNENAQIPMLWDMVYSAGSVPGRFRVGDTDYSIGNLRQFSYSFVTVPSNDLSKYKVTSTPVLRLANLSGGNYWGTDRRTGVSKSVKEIFGNFSSGYAGNLPASLSAQVPLLASTYNYFDL